MVKIRAVVLDFGGVLYRTPRRGDMSRWVGWVGAGRDPLLVQLTTAPEKTDIMKKVFTGEIPESELWDLIAGKLHIPRRMFMWLHKRSFTAERFNQPLADYVTGLRKNYRTAILSNAGDLFRPLISKPYRLEELVDQVIVSAEEGLAKPDERIFHLTCNRLGVLPAEVVFVDDLLENVEAARCLGMAAIHFQTTEQVLQDLKSRLVE